MQTFLTLNTHILLSNQTHAFHFITRMAMGKVSTEEAIEWVKKRCESF